MSVPPVKPEDFRAVIPGPTGSLCHKFRKLLSLPDIVYQYWNWMLNSDGTLSTRYKDEVCQIPCFDGSSSDSTGGTGTEGDASSFGAPKNLAASDGTYSDKIVLTWSSVLGGVSYDVFRALVNDVNQATFVNNTASTTIEDTDTTEGQRYNYWVKAVDSDGERSGFSKTDTGYASGELVAVSDLVATRGAAGPSVGGDFVMLAWTPASGADAYDIYRHTTDDFSAATLIDADRVPFKTYTHHLRTCTVTPCTKPLFAEGDNRLTYQNKIESGNAITKFYYWVVAKKKDNDMIVSTSVESNSASGWSRGFGDGTVSFVTSNGLRSGDTPFDITATGRWRFFLIVSGGFGAGGNGTYGAGGGGGGAVVEGVATLAAGGKIRVVDTPSVGGSLTNSETSGAAGPVCTLEYSADGTFTDTVDLVTSTQAGGGVWNAGGGGTGGSGGSASVDGAVSEDRVFDGSDGQDASGTSGGRGGSQKFSYELPEANYNYGISNPIYNGDALLGGGGGGSKAVAFNQFGGRSPGSRVHFQYENV